MGPEDACREGARRSEVAAMGKRLVRDNDKDCPTPKRVARAPPARLSDPSAVRNAWIAKIKESKSSAKMQALLLNWGILSFVKWHG